MVDFSLKAIKSGTTGYDHGDVLKDVYEVLERAGNAKEFQMFVLTTLYEAVELEAVAEINRMKKFIALATA